MFLNAMCTLLSLFQLKSQNDYHCLFSFSSNTFPLAPWLHNFRSFSPRLFSFHILWKNIFFFLICQCSLGISSTLSVFLSQHIPLGGSSHSHGVCSHRCTDQSQFNVPLVQAYFLRNFTKSLLGYSLEPQSQHVQSRILYNIVFLPSPNPTKRCL